MTPKPFFSTLLCLVASHGPEPTPRKSIFWNVWQKKSQITYNVYDIGKSDLVIFHARDVQSYVRTKDIQQIHNYRCPQQRMAFLNQYRLSLPEGFFNWTITFKRESDFPYPYGNMFLCRQLINKKPAKIPDYAAEKNKFVLCYVMLCYVMFMLTT